MNGLNPQQRAAVLATDRPLLVIAGAGSGKTRVITEKIAHLVRQGLPARHITALTFTNKAAREMKSRASRMLSDKEQRGLTVSTFHALGLDIVRKEHAALGFKSAISIFDEQDRIALLREVGSQRDERLDTDVLADGAARIGRWKNQCVAPEDALSNAANEGEAWAARLYEAYSRVLRSYNAVDFDDLILLPVQLFRRDAGVLERWRNRIRYLLVDEYQDTNETQYQLLKLLTGALGRFTVVGDDDQSIYAWRGAQPENLAQLQRDYPRLDVIKLEQNYRSTARILRAANRLISNNPHVFDKKLWSALGEGDPIRVLRHADELAEARQVASDIVHHRFRHNARFADYAILYRGNHQSRLFESALREFGIPYFITGGPSFFGYAEVKDLLAYLRLICNPDDDAAFLRIVNVPRREIGPTTLEKLGQYAQRRHVGLFAAIARRSAHEEAFNEFEQFVESIGYEHWLRENSTSTKAAERRMGNVRELIDWLKRIAAGDGERKAMPDAVAKLQLLDILDRQEEENSGDRVNLMTLHAAKGLEFPYVYLVGIEENLLPHQTSIEQETIEEERRLAYVGITRAQRNLVLNYCARRKRYGELTACDPSRFLEELPLADLEWPDRQPVDPELKKERGRASLAQLRGLLSEG